MFECVWFTSVYVMVLEYGVGKRVNGGVEKWSMYLVKKRGGVVFVMWSVVEEGEGHDWG